MKHNPQVVYFRDPTQPGPNSHGSPNSYRNERPATKEFEPSGPEEVYNLLLALKQHPIHSKTLRRFIYNECAVTHT